MSTVADPYQNNYLSKTLVDYKSNLDSISQASFYTKEIMDQMKFQNRKKGDLSGVALNII